MFDDGYSLSQILTTVTRRQQNSYFQRVIMQVHTDAVMRGIPLSKAMARHPDVFDQKYIATVREDELNGTLDQTLRGLF
jgi:type IV pilus assembly protein PilC